MYRWRTRYPLLFCNVATKGQSDHFHNENEEPANHKLSLSASKMETKSPANQKLFCKMETKSQTVFNVESKNHATICSFQNGFKTQLDIVASF
jgi:hypothetical protein